MLRLATATRTANVGRMAQQLPSAQSIVRPRSQLSWSGRSVATQSQAAQAAHQHREAEQSSDAAREREAASGVRARVQSKLRTLDASGPSAPSPFLRDRYARQHTYLRLSLTERCSLRCLYCMPADGVPLTPKPQLLTQPELARLANLFVQQGVNKIRLTGGEPTVRKDLVDVVASLNELKPLGLKQIGMTSNGIALHRKLPALVSSGLTHLNISLDTLDPFKFEFITRRRGLDAVMQSLSTAVALAVPSVKLNVVVIKGINDTKDVLDFVEFTKDWPITVRFIEYMPFDGNRWQEGKLVSYQTLLGTILEKYGDLQRLQDDANDTTKAWKVPGHKGQIGFITSMTDHFCGTCNRLRITADGNLKVCLFGNSEVSLRDAMRHGGIDGAGATDDQLLDVIGAAVGRKHARHAGPNEFFYGTTRQNGKIALRDTKTRTLHERSITSKRRTLPLSTRGIPAHLLASQSSMTTSAPGRRMYSSTQPRGPVDDADPPPSEQPSAPSAHTRTTEADTGAGPWDDLDAAFDAVSEKSFLTRSAAAESVFTTASKSAQAGVDGALPRATSAQNVQARESETDSGFPWASLDAAADADAVAVARSDAGSESFSKRESASADVGQGSAEGDAQSPRALTSRSSSNSNAQLTGPTKTPIGIALMPIMHSQPPSQPPNTPPPTTENAPKLTHVDAATGRASMVDVGHKSHTRRSATAIGRVYLPPIALQLIRSNEVGPAHSQSDRLTSPAWRQAAGKGPVLHTAQLAGIMAAKRTSELIPLCHSLPLSSVDVRFELVDPVDPVDPSADGANEHEPEPEPEEEGAWKLGQRGYVSITCTAHTSGQTGVEMEALMGVNVAALTVWDMVKAVAGRQMVVGDVMVVRKSGGKSGDWVRE